MCSLLSMMECKNAHASYTLIVHDQRFGKGQCMTGKEEQISLLLLFLLPFWNSLAFILTAPGDRRLLGGPAFLLLLLEQILDDWSSIFCVYQNYPRSFSELRF